jgi:hypothetical protein
LAKTAEQITHRDGHLHKNVKTRILGGHADFSEPIPIGYNFLVADNTTEPQSKDRLNSLLRKKSVVGILNVSQDKYYIPSTRVLTRFEIGGWLDQTHTQIAH